MASPPTNKIEGKLVAFVRTRVELLACLTRVKDAAGMAQPSADTVKMFASQLASMVCLSDGCAIELMQMFEAAGLVDADKKRAIDFVNDKLQDATSDDIVANDKDKQ